MRLWHKDLIPVIPDKQLLGQWRECCAIAKNIATKGTPNHILVNKILNYPICNFSSYARLVIDEMRKRGYKVSDYAENTFGYYIHIAGEKLDDFNFNSNLHPDYIFSDWHNDRYYVQCFFNLQEKYDCGGKAKKVFLRRNMTINADGWTAR